MRDLEGAIADTAANTAAGEEPGARDVEGEAPLVWVGVGARDAAAEREVGVRERFVSGLGLDGAGGEADDGVDVAG